ncbi:MAG: hypothetical protein F4Y69_09225 [Chloroflexi bacterium]|nr:hypothetical protein [Chloroflexota bacterium]MYF22041.1 hypothetical protein [Chloroflexota bacterium]
MRSLTSLFPQDTHTYRGDPWVTRFYLFLSLLITFRSLVHVFRKDGGANSIAGIDLDVEGGQNIVAIFAQWGLEQLLLAGFAWLALLRYRGLIPLVLLINLLDNIGRILIGRAKPLKIDRPPPGAYGQVLILPFLAVAFWQSLPRHRRENRSTF